MQVIQKKSQNVRFVVTKLSISSGAISMPFHPISNDLSGLRQRPASDLAELNS